MALSGIVAVLTDETGVPKNKHLILDELVKREGRNRLWAAWRCPTQSKGSAKLPLLWEGQTSYSFSRQLLLSLILMKAAFFSFVAAATLFATTAAAAAVPVDHERTLRRLSPRERARVKQAQRARERQQAIEQARWVAQHCHDRGPAKSYGHH
jgi:hypothetical protein